MPITSTYSVPGHESITGSIEYTTVDELLIQVPDNTENIIRASDLRDAVYTLWNRIGDSGGSFSVYYTNTDPVTATNLQGFPENSVPGIARSMQEMWDQLLYPYVKLTSSLSINDSSKEYGDPDGLESNSVVLTWSVTKKSKNISSVVLSSTNPSFTSVNLENGSGASQNGVYNTHGTHSWNSSNVSETNVYKLTTSDGTSTVNKTKTLTWMNQIYWGKIDINTPLGGDVDLTYNTIDGVLTPGLVDDVSDLCEDDLILGLSSQLSTTKVKSYDGIDGDGDHLIFAWPSSVPGSGNPSFYINGLPNTALTRVRNTSVFINQFGFETNYEVWLTNTVQNSPIDQFRIE